MARAHADGPSSVVWSAWVVGALLLLPVAAGWWFAGLVVASALALSALPGLHLGARAVAGADRRDLLAVGGLSVAVVALLRVAFVAVTTERVAGLFLSFAAALLLGTLGPLIYTVWIRHRSMVWLGIRLDTWRPTLAVGLGSPASRTSRQMGVARWLTRRHEHRRVDTRPRAAWGAFWPMREPCGGRLIVSLDIPTLERLITEQDEGWAISHARRLLDLIDRIGTGLDYDAEALTWAAYLLHDWGAFTAYRRPGVDHATRSAQIARDQYLPGLDLSDTAKGLVLEAIARHDYRDPLPVASVEAVLLREADMLDLIGMIGISRELAWGPNDLDVCFQRIRSRRYGIRGRFTLPTARAIAEPRLTRMDTCLGWFTDEVAGTD